MAINRNAYPCREIEMAERLTGKKEFGRFREIPNTMKLATIEVTSVKNARSSIIPFLRLAWCYLLSVALRERYSLTFLSIPLTVS